MSLKGSYVIRICIAVNLIALAAVTLIPSASSSLPVAVPIVVSEKPLVLFSLSEQRDSLVAREARRQEVPVWLALSIAHAENWTGDSTAVNLWSGAIGLGQIHPVNFGKYPECGENMVNRKTNVCYMMRILGACLALTLEETLNCYGGATSLEGKRAYNLDVNRRTRLEWL